MTTPDSPPPALHVACLCAAWCHVCNDWRPAFDELAAQAADGERWSWIDIEDDEALVGDVDVEDFPTLLITRGGQALHLGPVAPRAEPVLTLVEHARLGRMAPHDGDEASTG